MGVRETVFVVVIVFGGGTKDDDNDEEEIVLLYGDDKVDTLLLYVLCDIPILPRNAWYAEDDEETMVDPVAV